MNNRTKKKLNLNTDNLSLPLSGNLYGDNKRRISLLKLFRFLFLSTASLIIVVSLFSGAVTLYTNKSRAEIVSQDSVISSLAKHILLPDIQYLENMIRVSNADQLRSQNDFYKNINSGDYIIVYKNISIIYDYNQNTIKNVWTTKEIK